MQEAATRPTQRATHVVPPVRILIRHLAVVAEEGQDGDHASRWNVERQFILEDRELLDVLGQALYEIRAVRVKFLRGSGVFSSRRVWRGLFLEGGFGG